MKIQKEIHFLFVKSLQIYSTIWKFCSLKRFYLNRNTTEFVPCEQLSLKAGRYATKDEKPQRAIVCFSIEHVRQRDAHAKTSNDSTSSWFPRERQKNKRIVLTSKTEALLLHHTFLYTSFRFCTTTTWKCLISRLMENLNKQQWNFISLFELG